MTALAPLAQLAAHVMTPHPSLPISFANVRDLNVKGAVCFVLLSQIPAASGSLSTQLLTLCQSNITQNGSGQSSGLRLPNDMLCGRAV